MRITQGSVICNARSSKYPEIECHAIIITARCDLAQEKTDKVFYLIGIPFTKWIYSDSGFHNVIAGTVSNLLDSLKQLITPYELCLDDLFAFSEEDMCKVIEATIPNTNVKSKFFEKFKKYKHLTSCDLSFNDKKTIIQEYKNDITKYVSTISNGANSHYILLPKSVFDSCGDDYGIIVDLQELDYLQFSWIDPLVNGKFDVKESSVSEEDKASYDSKFHINSGSGYAMPYCEIASPWIEYVMQHFSNLFIRIGVDSLEKDDIKRAIVNISTLEEEK